MLKHIIMGIKICKRNRFLKGFLFFACYVIIGLLIYYPSLKLGFVSDDYLVFKRLFLDNEFWVEGFFRPLGDVTLFFNYITTGLDPFSFHITNVLIHSTNSFLVFRLLLELDRGWLRTLDRGIVHAETTAFIAGVLFLTYPFHSESVLWVISRSSAIATTFGILTFIAYFKLAGRSKFVFSTLFYFIGLSSFENIILIPIVIAIFELLNARANKIALWVVYFCTAFLIHLLFRYIFSGAVWGSYGGKMFDLTAEEYLFRYLKSFGRLILPPMENTTVAIGLAIASFAIICFMVLIMVKSKKVPYQIKQVVLGMILSLAVCMVLPGMFGISTHTSEGGRLLYFPSIFLCVLVSIFLSVCLRSTKMRMLALVVLTACNWFFLHRIQNNWRIASSQVALIKKEISALDKKKVFIINLPGEYNGAYVFRNGLSEAALLWGLNANIQVANILNHKELISLEEAIKPVVQAGILHIKPETDISLNDSVYNISSASRQFLINKSEWDIIYWNKKKFKRFF